MVKKNIYINDVNSSSGEKWMCWKTSWRSTQWLMNSYASLVTRTSVVIVVNIMIYLKKLVYWAGKWVKLTVSLDLRIMIVCLLTHWDLVTHICVNKIFHCWLDNGLSAVRRQTIIWTNTGCLFSIWTSCTKINVIWIEIQTYWLKNVHFKMPSVKWRSVCFGPNLLKKNQQGLTNRALNVCSMLSKIRTILPCALWMTPN